MKNREVYLKDPTTFSLINNGVSKVGEIGNDKEKIKTLRFELETFVCEGEYRKGLERILNAYFDGLSKPEQKAVWVSGFFGSGKSHFVKMLRYLWEDYTFEDGASARSLVKLPQDVKDLFVELSTTSKRCGGLKAVSGSLSEGSPEDVRLAFLQILFRAHNLPEQYSAARFILWLKQNHLYDRVVQNLKDAGHDPHHEMKNLYVSIHLAEALIDAEPKYGSARDALTYIKSNFQANAVPTIRDTIDTVRQIFTQGNSLPCTLIVIDEVQQYIGDKVQRAMDVQEIAEKCCSDLDSRVLLVGTGQSALTGSPTLQRLHARFAVKVSLSDADVEHVVRNTVLAKKPERVGDIVRVIDGNHGEVSRHLQNTKIASNNSDEADYALDYPLLPVRRRFWEGVLRNVDVSGVSAQLRTQLRIVFDAARETANEDLGSVVPADFIYDEISLDLLHTGILQREYHEMIKELRDGSEKGTLKSRVCATIFLISQFPKPPGSSEGIQATPDAIADLLVEDLKSDGAQLRQEIPRVLVELVQSGKVMSVGNEYCLQTKEGANWSHDFNQRRSQVLNDDTTIGIKRNELLRNALDEALRSVSISQGSSKQAREFAISTSNTRPTDENKLVLWMRDGWSEEERTVKSEARAAGAECPILFGMLPRIAHDDLKKSIATFLAAGQTLQAHSTPATPEAIQASKAIETQLQISKSGIDECVRQVLGQAKVFLGGGSEVAGMTIQDRVRNGAKDALLRLYPDFNDADHANWPQVLTRARNSDLTALNAVGHKGEVLNHPVCKRIYSYVNPSKSGKDVRDNFTNPPFGWPKDAVDASLVLMTLSGNLRTTLNDKPMKASELNQSTMGKYVFIVDIPPLTVNQRMDLRVLFKKMQVDLAQGEEPFATMTFLAKLTNLAKSTGGEPPLPEIPDISMIQELQGLSGNAQLLQIFNNKEDIENKIREWAKTRDAINQRTPRWSRLLELDTFAEGTPERETLQLSASAIKSNRTLLDKIDPVEPLIKEYVKILRTALNAVQKEMESTHSTEEKRLNAHPTWKRLGEEQRLTIIEKYQLHPPTPLNLKTEEDILDVLHENTIHNRRTEIEALPQRFQKATEEAAKLLEPKAALASLPAARIGNEEDLEKWLGEAREKIKKQLKNGPVIIK